MKRPYPTVLEFLSMRFPNIERAVWRARIEAGKVLLENRHPITLDTPYQPQAKLLYFREVDNETRIPFEAAVLFENDDLLVADKPHFLPVTPAGRFVNECLLYRLKTRTANAALAPLHRIDRGTAGLVLFSKRAATRTLYADLFKHGTIHKEYEAWCHCDTVPEQRHWHIENRLVDGEPWFTSQVVAGRVNARSDIYLQEVRAHKARFLLTPITGKKHQLRVHLSGLGFPIINDTFYPTLLPETADDFSKPLQLLAKRLEFRDPLSNEVLQFTSRQDLEA